MYVSAYRLAFSNFNEDEDMGKALPCAERVWFNFVSKVKKNDKRIIFINTLLLVSQRCCCLCVRVCECLEQSLSDALSHLNCVWVCVCVCVCFCLSHKSMTLRFHPYTMRERNVSAWQHKCNCEISTCTLAVENKIGTNNWRRGRHTGWIYEYVVVCRANWVKTLPLAATCVCYNTQEQFMQ